jgi:hypothetical protein
MYFNVKLDSDELLFTVLPRLAREHTTSYKPNNYDITIKMRSGLNWMPPKDFRQIANCIHMTSQTSDKSLSPIGSDNLACEICAL